MCQWFGTEPEGETLLRGRALNVDTRVVGSMLNEKGLQRRELTAAYICNLRWPVT